MKKKLPVIKTPENRAAYLAAYEAMFALWKVPHVQILPIEFRVARSLACRDLTHTSRSAILLEIEDFAVIADT